MTHETYHNCRLQNFHWKPEYILFSFEVLDQSINVHEVHIQTGAERFYTELMQLTEGKRTQGFFSYGMTDIDIIRMSHENILMSWSPCEVVYSDFFLPVNELQKLADWAATIKKEGNKK